MWDQPPNNIWTPDITISLGCCIIGGGTTSRDELIGSGGVHLWGRTPGFFPVARHNGYSGDDCIFMMLSVSTSRFGLHLCLYTYYGAIPLCSRG